MEKLIADTLYTYESGYNKHMYIPSSGVRSANLMPPLQKKDNK